MEGATRLSKTADYLTPVENDIVLASKIVVLVASALTLFLCFFNLYFLVFMQKKCRVITVTLFYVFSILTILAQASYTLTSPQDNYCNWGWLLTFYGESILNLNLGVVQASNITILASRLYYQKRLDEVF